MAGTKAQVEGIAAFRANTILASSSDRLQSLDGIDTRSLADNSTCFVDEQGGLLYRFFQGSTLTPDGFTVVAPLVGPGFWVLVSIGGDGYPARAHNSWTSTTPNLVTITAANQYEQIGIAPNPFVLNPTTMLFEQVDAGGAPTAGESSVRYTGGAAVCVIVDATVAVAAAAVGNPQVGLAVFLNGTERPNVEFAGEAPFLAGVATATLISQDQIELQPGDVVDLRIRNKQTTVDINVFSASLRIAA